MTAQLLALAPNLVDQVYRALLDAISTGALAPGQRVTQEELAERFDVSRQPVMQALRLLRQDGFVRDAPLVCGTGQRTRGLQVAPLDARRIEQVYQVRGALELLAVRLAAERHATIDPALLAAGRSAEQRGDLKAMIDADMAFHGALYRAADNPLIEQTAQLHWQHIRRAMGVALQYQPHQRPLWDEHEAIARAVAAGNVGRAESLMRSHTGRASDELVHELLAQARHAAPSVDAAAHPLLRGHRLNP